MSHLFRKSAIDGSFAKLTPVITPVGRIFDEESAHVGAERMAAPIAMGYENAAENDGQARESCLCPEVVPLLR